MESDFAVEFSEGSFGKQYPHLWAFLAAASYDDGQARATGTLLLFTEAGRVKACLSDRECQEVAFVTAASMVELFQAVEEQLGTSEGDWRPMRKKSR